MPVSHFSAVRGGFEPPVRLPVRQFSKLVVSATHPSHLKLPIFPIGVQIYEVFVVLQHFFSYFCALGPIMSDGGSDNSSRCFISRKYGSVCLKNILYPLQSEFSPG